MEAFESPRHFQWDMVGAGSSGRMYQIDLTLLVGLRVWDIWLEPGSLVVRVFWAESPSLSRLSYPAERGGGESWVLSLRGFEMF